MPWRSADLDAPHPDPYAVLVSELMLQQTQVVTVIPYFQRWMAQFPTASSLAVASEDALHKAWEGLGYYRRARFLQAAATRIAKDGWPADLKGLLDLPGLGPYTAAAVASIAFQWPEPALDGNAFRVLARLLALTGDPTLHAQELREALRPILAAHGPSRMTQALMELGATVCLPRTPQCEGCPLSAACIARARGLQDQIPPPKERPVPKQEAIWLLAVEADGHWLLRAPASKGLLAGLWSWPHLPISEGAAEEVAAYGTETRAFPGWTQVYTHRKEQVSPLHLKLLQRATPPEGLQWVAKKERDGLPMGKRDRRLLELLSGQGETPLTLPASVLEWLQAARN